MDGNLKMLHGRRILAIHLLSFCLIRRARTISTMSISLLKRKRLFHIPGNLKILLMIVVTTSTSPSKSTGNSQRSWQPQPNYQTPASALYDAVIEAVATTTASEGEFSAPSSADSLAMMEFYMKKASQEERRKPFKQSNDEMPPPTSLQASSKRGHHMGDYIPQEELEKFMASCNDASAQKSAKETAEKAKIQADNVGHKLLSKMGWREGEGLGSSRSGIADPIMASNLKQDHLGWVLNSLGRSPQRMTYMNNTRSE